MTSAPQPEASLCTRCGAAFTCHAATGQTHCWCFSLPALPTPDAARGCYCPACLNELTGGKAALPPD